MTDALAFLVIVVALGIGLAFVWWMFSGASAWIEPDEPTPAPPALPRIDNEDRDDD